MMKLYYSGLNITREGSMGSRPNNWNQKEVTKTVRFYLVPR